MALLVVRLLGWALHLETGRVTDDEPEEDETEDYEPTACSGQLVDTDEAVEPRLGFAPPGVEPAIWE